MLRAYRKSNKYQFYSSWFDRGSNPWSTTLEASTLTIMPPMRCFWLMLPRTLSQYDSSPPLTACKILVIVIDSSFVEQVEEPGIYLSKYWFFFWIFEKKKLKIEFFKIFEFLWDVTLPFWVIMRSGRRNVMNHIASRGPYLVVLSSGCRILFTMSHTATRAASWPYMDFNSFVTSVPGGGDVS
jgi:hypothetical protein